MTASPAAQPSLTKALGRGLYAAAGELQALVADVGVEAAYLVYVAPARGWEARPGRPVEIFSTRQSEVRSLLETYTAGWKWLLSGTRSTRPLRLPALLQTTLVAATAIDVFETEPWELRCVSVDSATHELLLFGEDGWPELHPAGAS